MRAMKEMVSLATYTVKVRTYQSCQLSNDPTLSSLPLLATFLKSYACPFLGLLPAGLSKQISSETEPGSLSASQPEPVPPMLDEGEQLVEKDIRDRFKRMSEGYFENVCKKLVIEHTVGINQKACVYC